jgi:error-prone DNA polymerase
MYVELHARSGFSFLEGASVPEEMAGACAQSGAPAMALLDRNGVYGAPRFHMAAKKAGIRAHIGAEITCTNGNSYPLLAATREGYQNLCRLITRIKLRAKKGEGAATLDELAEFARGLICLTRHPEAQLLDIFGRSNVYAELQRHHRREEEAANQAIVERARRLRIPLVATNGAAYATPAQRELLDVFTCVRNHVTLAGAGRLLERNAERHVKTPAEMVRLFADLPEALANTLEISSRLEFTLDRLGYEFPRYPVPTGETMAGFLRARVDEGARRRYQPYHDRARRQIERELALIEKLKLPGYFLIVWDIVRFCQGERHSGAGPRLGRQQRGLLCARNHRRGPGRHGSAVRTLPLRRARRMARYRYRSAQRRTARARHPARVPALRKAGRGHDRQRHHLSRPLRRARSGQGAGLRSYLARKTFQTGAYVGVARS